MPVTDHPRQDWVLDLRTWEKNSPDGMRLTNAPSSGEANGYTVRAQRRARENNHVICIVLGDPQGRLLNLVGYSYASTTNARTLVSSTLSRPIAAVLGDNPLPAAQSDLAAHRIASVMAIGQTCLRTGIEGEPARLLVQSAAEDLDADLAVSWIDAFRGTAFSPTLGVREVAWLVAAGFTHATTREWFTDDYGRIAIRSSAAVATAEAFRDAGWSAEAMRRVQGSLAPGAASGWAPLGEANATLAIRAGLNLREAKRLLRTGTWDATTLETLAALAPHGV